MNLDFSKYKNIHIVGVSGSEGSAILSFLIKHNITSITAHDYINKNDLENNFKTWHKGINLLEKEKLWQLFSENIKNIRLFLGKKYLQGVNDADIIFVPQSWRLYKKQNEPLFKAKENGIPFYSLTRIYLENTKATTIAVTGTVGKGSVSNLIYQILKKCLTSDSQVYFSGNETWMPQIADKLDMMKTEDFLILEISHRQLLDGITYGPNIAVFTNLYPNHLDEINWIKYKKVKLSLLKSQSAKDISILNYDIPELKQLEGSLKSSVIFFSLNNLNINTKSVRYIYRFIIKNIDRHYRDNVLAAITTARVLKLDSECIKKRLLTVPQLPARLELIGVKGGISFYDDIKSTTPWATMKAIEKLGPKTILICGGDIKGIDYQHFLDKIKSGIKFTIFLKSELSNKLIQKLPTDSCTIVNDLHDGLTYAYRFADNGDNILISPAAAFFYSKFIAKKKSLRKIFTSLPPKEKV